MYTFWLILLAYLSMPLRWVTTHLFRVTGYLPSSKKQYFKKGDLVETQDGTQGRVWKVYVKIKTGKPEACSILWETEYKGEKITPIVPIIDKTPEFNPIIRKVLS